MSETRREKHSAAVASSSCTTLYKATHRALERTPPHAKQSDPGCRRRRHRLPRRAPPLHALAHRRRWLQGSRPPQDPASHPPSPPDYALRRAAAMRCGFPAAASSLPMPSAAASPTSDSALASGRMSTGLSDEPWWQDEAPSLVQHPVCSQLLGCPLLDATQSFRARQGLPSLFTVQMSSRRSSPAGTPV